MDQNRSLPRTTWSRPAARRRSRPTGDSSSASPCARGSRRPIAPAGQSSGQRAAVSGELFIPRSARSAPAVPQPIEPQGVRLATLDPHLPLGDQDRPGVTGIARCAVRIARPGHGRCVLARLYQASNLRPALERRIQQPVPPQASATLRRIRTCAPTADAPALPTRYRARRGLRRSRLRIPAGSVASMSSIRSRNRPPRAPHRNSAMRTARDRDAGSHSVTAQRKTGGILDIQHIGWIAVSAPHCHCRA